MIDLIDHMKDIYFDIYQIKNYLKTVIVNDNVYFGMNSNKNVYMCFKVT